MNRFCYCAVGVDGNNITLWEDTIIKKIEKFLKKLLTK